MSNPIRIRMMPPAILNAGSVIPNILKIQLPARANEHSTIAQVHAARRATCRRSDSDESAVTATNSGITVNGSTRKNTDVNASSANSRIAVRFIFIQYADGLARMKCDRATVAFLRGSL